MYVDFILVSESEIALNTRAWKLSRSRVGRVRDARVGIVITMIHRIYIMTMPTRASRDRDNFHARVFKAISLSETRIKSTYISGLPMIIGKKKLWLKKLNY